MNSEKLLTTLKQNTILFIQSLRNHVFSRHSDASGELLLVEVYFSGMPDEKLMQHMLKHLLPHKKQIVSRNVKFFLKNRGIFSGLEEDRIDFYAKHISDGHLDEDTMSTIWEYFDTFLALVEAYKKKK